MAQGPALHRRMAWAGGSSLPPVPGRADVPAWWLEERARVVADDLSHQARARKPR
jgi:hypothetical protein